MFLWALFSCSPDWGSCTKTLRFRTLAPQSGTGYRLVAIMTVAVTASSAGFSTIAVRAQHHRATDAALIPLTW